MKRSSGTQVGTQTAGTSTFSPSANMPMTIQGIVSPGIWSLRCQRVSATGNWLAGSPKLTAIAVS